MLKAAEFNDSEVIPVGDNPKGIGFDMGFFVQGPVPT